MSGPFADTKIFDNVSMVTEVVNEIPTTVIQLPWLQVGPRQLS